MNYPNSIEQKISFDKVRDLISDKCLSPLGKEQVELMSFSSDFETVKMRLEECGEMMQILSQESDFPANYFFDVRGPMKRIRIEGTYLDQSELFDLRRSLETINSLVKFFLSDESLEKEELYPRLTSRAKRVEIFPTLLEDIDRILDRFGQIKDSASSELQRIRRELLTTASGVSKTLNAILRSAQEQGFVEKDMKPTMRDGRLVIPIAPSYKRKIKGIVHDESASGKTVFVEPAQVVEANNHIRELENQERREILRILVEFADKLRPFCDDIVESYSFLALVDFTRAKGIFAIDTDAVAPVVENYCQVDWYGAKHPLLLLSLRKQNKPIVPLDIQLVGDKRLLIISGPNAGGKSVCLKTVGLLQYMLQSGVPVPLYENSRIGIFDDIFIDIGDEQSIENDLSTYSSHLTNMKSFLRGAHSKSLLLIDEFGGGTEPTIGGAIAESLLDRFNQKGAFGVITTHYQNLKHFAENHSGIVNGAMLYDRHQMQPLFKLSIGNPGSSFAIEIARKIGLPEDLIASASELVGSNYIEMDKYLQDIVRDKRYWENKRSEIRRKEKQLEEATVRFQQQSEALDKDRKEIVRKAKADALELMSRSNAIIEKTIREIKEAQAEKEATKLVRSELEMFKDELRKEAADPDSALNRKIDKLKRREKDKANRTKESVAPEKKVEAPLVVGDTVRIKGQTTVGEILEIQAKQCVVAFGLIKTSVKIERIERVGKRQAKKEQQKVIISSQTSNDIRDRQLHFQHELDVRGMRADEALQAVAYYIDDALLCAGNSVRILHGTGTGALRQVIRQYLATVPGIKHFRDEHVQFGGAGITVIEFN
ncbi:MAG: endonuclease MutS2 [Bacteroidales bacterium]